MLQERKVNLHLFDGAAAPGGGEGGQADAQGVATPTGRESLKNVVYGKQQGQAESQTAQGGESQAPFARSEEDTAAVDPAKAFEDLIKGEYKEQFSNKVQSILDRRFKTMNDQQEQMNAYKSVIDPLMDIYEAKDMAELREAVLKDNGKIEELADDMGMTVEQYLAYQETMRKNAAYKKAEEERLAQEESNRIYEDWMRQAEELKEDYPDFDLEAECEDPAFVDLISRPNISVRTAYEAIHLKDILKGTASHVAEAVRQNTVETIRARGYRPTENGLSEAQGIVHKTDASKLSKEDRAEIAKRAARGETISF